MGGGGAGGEGAKGVSLGQTSGYITFDVCQRHSVIFVTRTQHSMQLMNQ